MCYRVAKTKALFRFAVKAKLICGHLLKHGTGRNEKKTEQTERYGTDYYGIRNKDGTNRMRKDGTG